MLLLSHLRTLFTASFFAFFIVACGGGGSGTNASSVSLADDPTANQPVSTEVLGDDVDADGIRDDIQSYIETEYFSNPEALMRFREFARADRKLLQSLGNSEDIESAARERMVAHECLADIFSTKEWALVESKYNLKTYNTDERIELFFNIEGGLYRFSYPEFNEQNCQ